MVPRVYVDTSVFGGCLEAEFRTPSNRLLAACERGALRLVISEMTIAELEAAPDEVRGILRQVPTDEVELLLVTPEADELAAAYLADGAIGARMRADALHIAAATIARVDVLVSWNFRHIVNLQRIHAYNSVNLKRGYPLLEIRTPREVVPHE
ncbi:MAG TPA: PIN domain-containing protein [Thermoanaerobaculia bacterium]|nr:PIN domain-containing protein [Thermoanaerobaculia bacterium]